MQGSQNIAALINLLDDPDQKIFDQISQELLNLGAVAVPFLEDAWENSFNAILQNRIEQVLHQIQFQGIIKGLQEWKKTETHDLLEAAILIAKYQYADIDEESIYTFTDQLYQEIWLELNGNLTALEKAHVLNKIFFEINGFGGNKKNFHSPKNSFINNVIESKKGSPILLSLLYIAMAKRLKVPVYGVNLPEHFILAYTFLPIQFYDKVDLDDVLFYINPFNKGTIFQKKDIDTFLKQLKLEEKTEFYLPCKNLTLICQILKNLIFSYNRTGYIDKEAEIKLLLDILEA
jgi:regulator of sirC expression with transglutaminase-like and TPR domain